MASFLRLGEHLCPGCGEWLYHGTHCCLRCEQEIRRGER
jgi:predicted amidophosphoribosyltransferase